MEEELYLSQRKESELNESLNKSSNEIKNLQQQQQQQNANNYLENSSQKSPTAIIGNSSSFNNTNNNNNNKNDDDNNSGIATNYPYLRNVIYKFLIADDQRRPQLVPVIANMLKLTPIELSKINLQTNNHQKSQNNKNHNNSSPTSWLSFS